LSRRRPRLTTVPESHPPKRRVEPPPPPHSHKPSKPPPRLVARIIDQSDSSLLDVLDNLLNRGVVLNADIILALADVDLVYVKLSALLCAADLVLTDDGPR
jgi:hypothetical protein